MINKFFFYDGFYMFTDRMIFFKWKSSFIFRKKVRNVTPYAEQIKDSCGVGLYHKIALPNKLLYTVRFRRAINQLVVGSNPNPWSLKALLLKGFFISSFEYHPKYVLW